MSPIIWPDWCDLAMCAPDSPHLAAGKEGEARWLRDRLIERVGDAPSVDELQQVADAWWARMDAAPSHSIGHIPLSLDPHLAE